MDKTLKKNIRIYLKEIKKYLPYSYSTKSAFISIFKKRIYEFLEDNSLASYEDIVKEFGSPEEIICSLDSEEYENLLKTKKKQFLWLKIISAVLAITLVISLFVLYKSSENNNIYINNEYDNVNK